MPGSPQADGTPDHGEASEDDPLAKLAAVMLALSPSDRAKLAAMLTGDANRGETP